MPAPTESLTGSAVLQSGGALTFRAQGKLLIAGEYLVLSGARALAVPLKYGQFMQIENIYGKFTHWTSEDSSGVWFRAVIDMETLGVISPDTDLRGKEGTVAFLENLLRRARVLNPQFIVPGHGLNVRVTADYPLEWGLGSSSSLISLVAQWAGVSAAALFKSVSNGSGYDIACASSSGPLFYQLDPVNGDCPEKAVVSPVLTGPALKEYAYFAWLGKKQDSRMEVSKFRASAKFSLEDIARISELSVAICSAGRPEELCRYVHEHEAILSRILQRDVLKARFPGFPGAVKSLGAWGGDFAMFVSRQPFDEVEKILGDYGITEVFTYDDICIETDETIALTGPFIHSSPTLTRGGNFSVTWESPSNIAFIKYWGKKGRQLPANPSLSMTLGKAVSRTRLAAIPGGTGELISVNADPGHPFLYRLEAFLTVLRPMFPWIDRYSFEAETSNSFPDSAGIASSASGLSAFTLCLLDIHGMVSGKQLSDNEFRRMASGLARRGSGSASRSVYGGYAVWGETPLIKGSSDEHATPLKMPLHDDFLELHDAILIVSSEAKSISSSSGHALIDSHPLAAGRYIQARQNLAGCLEAMQTGDFGKFASVVENEALSLHSLIMTSAGSHILIKPESLQIMQRIREARRNGLPVCFTLDAGPNIHLLYPAGNSGKVKEFIGQQLLEFCQDGRFIDDHYGEGPRRISLENDGA
jgi:diphosphomevalonate decarboxylase